MRSSAGPDFDTPFHTYFRLGWSSFWEGNPSNKCRFKKGSFEYRRFMDGWRDAADGCNIKATKRGAHSGTYEDEPDTTS